MAKRKKAEKGASEAPSFEEALRRLEEIVEQLEEGELPLERAIALFEEGVVLGRRCGATLDGAERKITLLLERADGTLEETDLDPAAPDDQDDHPAADRGAPRDTSEEAVDDELPF